jgi:AmiR/NasT family two-component response regulator
LQATLAESRVLRQLAQQTIARSRAARAQVLSGRSQREILHDLAFVRLAARHETMAVIEQAKGIIMAQRQCGPEAAFDLLRQASQRANLKVNVLAAQIVGQTAASGNHDSVTLITLGAARHHRPGPRTPPPAGC